MSSVQESLQKLSEASLYLDFTVESLLSFIVVVVHYLSIVSIRMCLRVSLVYIHFLVCFKSHLSAILYRPPRLRCEGASTMYHDFTRITREKTKPRLHHIHPTEYGHVCSIVPPMSGNPAFCFTPCVQLSAPFRVNR